MISRDWRCSGVRSVSRRISVIPRHAVHGGPDLMAHVGEKGALHAGGPLGPLRQLPHALLRLLPLGHIPDHPQDPEGIPLDVPEDGLHRLP